MNKPVRSADRTLAIFEAFAAAGRQLQLREIAERCDLPLSTCHALVQTLLKRGYLYTIGRRKELYPNARLLKLAETITANDPFISHISENLQRLCRECAETVTVGKRQGDEVLYLFACEASQPIRYAAKVGEHRSLHSTALGKALLSEMDPQELKDWLATHALKKITAKTITTNRKLLQEVEEGRMKGYFIASGEQADDLTTVAVPLKHHTEPLAISITGPTHRVLPMLDDLGKKLLSVKKEIEEAIPK